MPDVSFEVDPLEPVASETAAEDSLAPVVGPTAPSPVAAALLHSRLVPNERVARIAILSAAALGVGGAFVSIYLSLPERGIAGTAYVDLSPVELAEIPLEERAFLENVEVAKRERGRAAY